MRSFVSNFAAILGLILGPCVSCLCCYNVHAIGLQPGDKLARHYSSDCAGKSASSDHSNEESHSSDSGDDCCKDCNNLAPLKKLAILTDEQVKQGKSALTNNKFKKSPPETLDLSLNLYRHGTFDSHGTRQTELRNFTQYQSKLRSLISKAVPIRGPPLTTS